MDTARLFETLRYLKEEKKHYNTVRYLCQKSNNIDVKPPSRIEMLLEMALVVSNDHAWITSYFPTFPPPTPYIPHSLLRTKPDSLLGRYYNKQSYYQGWTYNAIIILRLTLMKPWKVEAILDSNLIMGKGKVI